MTLISSGLSLYWLSPSWLSSSTQVDITSITGNWRHASQANGGYISASTELACSVSDIDDWLANGIGRVLTLYDATLAVAWSGIVNTISANVGPRSITVGPLLNIANAVSCVYSTVDASFTPPAVGVRARTSLYTDTDSIEKYGYMRQVLSVGGASQPNAEQIAQTYMTDYNAPKSNQTLTLGRSGKTLLSIDCIGVSQFLNTYVYNSTTTGNTTASAKIQAILTACPTAGLFSSDYSRIGTNTTAVGAYEMNDKTASDVLYGEVAKGDAAYTRWIFGVYSDGIAEYSPVATDVKYYYENDTFYNSAKTKVAPASIKPGHWIFDNSQSPGAHVPTLADQDDLRFIFIESVDFVAPSQCTVKGGAFERLPQLLARLGLGGVGA